MALSDDEYGTKFYRQGLSLKSAQTEANVTNHF